ncbi:MAG TPA: DUF456 domain-containing protein [Oleiagrimonas sp.]|nr:DUF456 domain-containing protein [Oleiagrimonas sp.]
MPVLDIVLYVVAGLLVLGGLAGAILPILPGIPMIFGGLWLASWVDGYQHAGAWTLGIIALIGVIAMALDFVAGAFGAKRVGASKMAIWGAFLGTIAGMFFGIVGIIVGPFVGALVGELANGNSVLRSTHVSIGTWVGMLLGTLAKLVLSFMMIGVYLVALLV